MKMSLKLVAVAAAVASAFALSACGDKKEAAPAKPATPAAPAAQSKAAEPLKVGFVYVAPIADVGYTKQHDIGRIYAIDKVGKDKVTTTFVENVPETADAERVIRQMVADGNKLIFGTSFGYMNYMQKLAKEYPDVKFEHATGYKTASNMTNYNIRFYEGRYLAGMLAGGATKSNIIGYVAPFPIPEVLQGINAFTLGAKSVNPNIQVKVIWTNAWYDPPKDTDSAKTLLGQGADILTQHTNTSAVASAAEAAGKMVIPYNSDMKSVAPNAQIAALVLNWGPYYAKKIQQDRIELMRLKQGIITESDTIYEEKEEKPKMSFWKKLGNFLYHSKWWLGITVFIVGVFVFLIVDYVTKVRPDMIVLLITDDTEMQNHRQQLEEYLEQFTDDENGDGKVHVDIYPIPVSDNIDDMDYFTGNSTKLSAEFQMGEAVMVITDAKANEYIMADETLTDLSEKYTGHENIRGNGYYLRHTDFATKIDYPGNVDRDLSIGLRAPVKTSDSKEKMQKTYDVAEKVLLRVMDDLDNTTEPEDIVTTEPAETAVTTTKED